MPNEYTSHRELYGSWRTTSGAIHLRVGAACEPSGMRRHDARAGSEQRACAGARRVRAPVGAGLGGVLCTVLGRETCEAKVGEEELLINSRSLLHQHVGTLDVSMDHAARMQVGDAARHLTKLPRERARRERRVTSSGGGDVAGVQRAAVAKFAD